MAWLGIRCAKAEIVIVAVEDSNPPTVAFEWADQPPQGLDAAATAAWFAKCTVEAIERILPDGVSIRVSDGDVQAERARHEGAVMAAVHQCDLPVRLMIRQRMQKPLMGTGKPPAGAWKAFPTTDPFISGLKVKLREAAMASLAATRS